MQGVVPDHIDPQTWYVVFGPGRLSGPRAGGLAGLVDWVVRRQPPRWQHVWAFTVSVRGWWVVYPGLDGLACYEDGPGLLDRLREQPPQNVAVLRVVECRPGAFAVNWTCARTIAGLVGAGKFRGLTPRQLYHHLRETPKFKGELVHGIVY